jgi:hypothetical protein
MEAPADARLFVEALDGDAMMPMTFQTFDDSPAKRPWLIDQFHGTLSQYAWMLKDLNDGGAHIAVMVNAGDLKGRTAQNVTRLRALWIDEDRPKKRRFRLAPSIVVRSKRGEHAYWLLNPGTPLARFTASQKQLAAFYGTDSAVTDLPHAMRLPGFLHRKDKPFDVRLLHADGSMRYDLDTILAAHPVRWRRSPQVCPPRCDVRDDDVARYLAWVHARPMSEGSRNRTAFSIAAEGFKRGLARSTIAPVVYGWCERAGIPREAKSIIASAERYDARRTG